VYLAFDLGAESGRAVLASFRNGVLTMRELHRFANEPVAVGGSIHWDVLRLWSEVQKGLALAASAGDGTLAGVGLDTWGVDFAFLDEKGSLLGNPFHYRDSRTDGVPATLFGIVPQAEVHRITGIQFMQINSLYQLFAASRQTPQVLQAARALLTIPDLFHHWLSGVTACEFTNATTTQMLDARSGDWARPMLAELGIPTHFLQPIVQPGTVLGELQADVLRRSGLKSAPLIVPACHDTGSAVAAIAMTPTSVYLSSGTWSLMGAEVPKPIINEHTQHWNFTNEGGVGGTTRLLKNIGGMWLLQGCRKQWTAEGRSFEYAELAEMVKARGKLDILIDPDHPSFLHPMDMTLAIRDFCKTTGQRTPESYGDYVQVILESLALKYRYVLEALEQITGNQYDEIRVVGGGARNRLLNQFTADATGRRVVAGPVEATALGNIAIQLLATGAVASLTEARQVIDRSFPVEQFAPQNVDAWDKAYSRFKHYCQVTAPAIQPAV
jgi:rhamnulokinase